jgi:hypothetical protein
MTDYLEMKAFTLVLDASPSEVFIEGHISGSILIDKMDLISVGLKMILSRYKFTVLMGPDSEKLEDVFCFVILVCLSIIGRISTKSRSNGL